ncbi:MAG: hypothetical protein ACK45H_11105 [Bacteroidota bacterium]|jgi:hypothetical protein
MATAVPEVAKKSDIQKGWMVALACITGILIYLILATYQMADPPPLPYVMETTPIFPEELDLKNLVVESGNSGQGTPTDDPLDKPTPQQQEVLSSTKERPTKTESGKSNKTNTQSKTDNGPSTSNQSNDPFGTGGQGGGSGSGKGPFGEDVGNDGDGPPGPGSGDAGRVRLNDPETNHIVPDKNAEVHLKVTINSSGTVVSAVNIPSKTTTTDGRIINQVIAAVKNDVRYSKAPGTPNSVQYITVKLYAR